MRYFVTADPHGFFTIMHDALIAQGFDEDNPEHKLVICGDLMDRGKEARKMQAYILSLCTCVGITRSSPCASVPFGIASLPSAHRHGRGERGRSPASVLHFQSMCSLSDNRYFIFFNP